MKTVFFNLCILECVQNGNYYEVSKILNYYGELKVKIYE